MLQDWLHSGSTEVILHELFTPQKQIVESREQIGSCYAHHPALPFDHTCMNKAQWLLSPYVFLDFPGFARHLVALKCNSIGDGITLLNQAHDTKVLLVERKFAFARRVGKDFHLTEKGQIVASGEMEQLTDKFN